MSPATKGVVAVLVGFLLTLALGTLHIWVLVAAELLLPLSAGGSHEWTVRQVSVPFAVAGACFVLAMIVGGSVQDRLGPRWPSTAGGVLIGLGMILASMSEARLGGPNSLSVFMVLGFGFMVGGGAGLTFSSVVPPAVKWSVPRRRGLVVGSVIAGFALGPAWLNDAVRESVHQRGVSSILLVQGIALLAIIVALSQLLEDPLPGYVPPGSYSGSEGAVDGPVPWAGLSSRTMLSTPTFRALWSGSGLLGAAATFLAVRLMFVVSSDPASGSLLVVGVALAGSMGGVIVGVLRDRMDQRGPLALFALLAVSLASATALVVVGQFAAAALLTAASLVGGVVVAGVSTMECFGTRSAGENVGITFTGWSVGLLFGALAAVYSVGEASWVSTAAPGGILIGVALASVLGAAVLLAARVRPPAAPTAEYDGLGQHRGGAQG